MNTTLELCRLIEPLRPAAERIAEAAQQIELSEERTQTLEAASRFVTEKGKAGEPADLLFICTHNSRRSHLSQVWAKVAAIVFGLDHVATYSGGTEATACNIRTIRSMRRSGISIVDPTSGNNPRYLAQIGDSIPPALLFSKRFDDSFNPQEGFAAFMTCDSAAEACPFVPGAALRLNVPFIDPKVSDDSPEEAATYDLRSAQIAAELWWMMSQVVSL